MIQTQVETVMESAVATVSPECPARTAADRLRECDVAALVGLVTTADLAHYLPRHRLDVAWNGAPLAERRKTAPLGD